MGSNESDAVSYSKPKQMQKRKNVESEKAVGGCVTFINNSCIIAIKQVE